MTTNKILFEVQGNQFCCGVYELGRFDLETHYTFGSRMTTTFPTIQAALNDFEERWIEQLTERWDSDSFEDSDDKQGYLLRTTVVTKFKWADDSYSSVKANKMLYDHFLSTEWVQTGEFVNHNTGNTVACLERFMPASELANYVEPSEDADFYEDDED